MHDALERLRAALAARATEYDRAGAWPEKSLDVLGSAGAWKWAIPRAYSGEPLDPIEHLRRYEAIAAGCLSTLLILTNRDSACELIADSENESLKGDILPLLAANRILTTVGIAQLTTSHQSGPPALTATAEGGGFVLRGFMPWVTSAVKCQTIVAGARLADGRQVLASIPTDIAGLSIDPPLELVCMQGTLTSRVRCDGVRVEPRHLLRGPAAQVLATRSGIKPALVVCSGVGLAQALVDLIGESAPQGTGGMAAIANELTKRLQVVRDRVYRFAASKQAAEREKSEVRIMVNELLVRLAVAALTIAKGSGLQRSQDAQRLVREALFFLVWAAPEDVRIDTLRRFVRYPDHFPTEPEAIV
jgi:alkylation response protein AidB-like acyl-CoA dehydrogenase